MSALTQRLGQQFRNSGAGRWYYGKDAGERRIVRLVTTLVLLGLAYLLIWKPLTDWRAVAHNRYQAAQTNLEWLRANESRARASASIATPSAAADGSNVPVITRAARGHGLTLNRLQPRSDGGVTVSVEGQSFDNLLAWLAGLHENNGISVSKLSISQKDVPGLVDAQLDLN